jgi:adenylate cyclase
MLYRIGINLGDVMIDGDDVYGDGVNIAARLEALAEPGGICISQTVLEHVQDRIDAPFEDMGEVEVKNIARPIRVWRWTADRTTEMPANDSVADGGDNLPLPDKPSIAVLPFDNMSGDEDQEYFADGIAEDVITALSRFSSLFVIARNSSFSYKGTSPDIRAVARELGVRYVVEGSVRKAGGRVRITAQLIDAVSGNHLWADRFDGALDDVFDLQDRITEQIVISIAPEIEAHERERARRQSPESLGAWEIYQRGLWHLNKLTKEDVAEARRLFDSAIERDRDFASPHAGKAYTFYFDIFQGYSDDPDDSLAAGLAAAQRAVVLDDKDSFSHYVFGRMLAISGELDRGIAELEKSVALNPSFAHGYYGLGAALNWNGRASEAVDFLDKALRLSPNDPMLWAMQSVRATSCNAQEKYVEAEAWARKAVNARPDMHQTHLILAVALVGQQRLPEARLAVEAARRARPDLKLSVARRLIGYIDETVRERYIDAWRVAGLPEE